MRLPILEGDLYVSNFEILIEDGVVYVVDEDSNRFVLDIPAVQRDHLIAKIHGCDPGRCPERSHTWRARDEERT